MSKIAGYSFLRFKRVKLSQIFKCVGFGVFEVCHSICECVWTILMTVLLILRHILNYYHGLVEFTGWSQWIISLSCAIFIAQTKEIFRRSWL